VRIAKLNTPTVEVRGHMLMQLEYKNAVLIVLVVKDGSVASPWHEVLLVDCGIEVKASRLDTVDIFVRLAILCLK